MFQQVLPFDDFYAWRELIKSLRALHRGERFVFYGVGKKIQFTRLNNTRVQIVTEWLITGLPTPSFEVTFMAAVLKDTHKHLHIYEKSATRQEDWKKQIYRCIDPDCKTYYKAEQIIGKRARCHECKSEIIIEKSQVRNAVIVGLCCSKSLKAIRFRNARATMKDIFAEAQIKAEAEIAENHETSMEDTAAADKLSELIESGFEFPSGVFHDEH